MHSFVVASKYIATSCILHYHSSTCHLSDTVFGKPQVVTRATEKKNLLRAGYVRFINPLSLVFTPAVQTSIYMYMFYIVLNNLANILCLWQLTPLPPTVQYVCLSLLHVHVYVQNREIMMYKYNRSKCTALHLS